MYGALYQAGKHSMGNKTLDGPKPLASSYSPTPSPGLQALTDILKYTATTKALSKVGVIPGAEMDPSMNASNRSMHSLRHSHTLPPSLLPTFPANSTQLMPHPVASTRPATSYSHPSNYLLALTTSSSTPPSHTPHWNSGCSAKADTPEQLPKALQKQLHTLIPRSTQSVTPSIHSSSNSKRNGTINGRRPLLPLPTQIGTSRPHPYHPGLVPTTSSLCPHCLSKDRLRLWTPAQPCSSRDVAGHPMHITDSDLDRILAVISASWAQGTHALYGSGLLAYHVFCDERNIPEPQRCSASPILILAFIAKHAGAYSGKTLANHVFAV
jgi:hypothetical protein